MTKQELIDVLEYCRKNDFIGAVIDVLKGTTENEQPAGQLEVGNMQEMHEKVLALCNVNYPTETENENGRVIIRRKEKKYAFAFREGVLLKLFGGSKEALQEYLRFARRNGYLATNTKPSYTATVSFGSTAIAAYCVYFEPKPKTNDEKTFLKIIDLFSNNEEKFDRRTKNEYGRRVSGYGCNCYALLPGKLEEIVSSFGGNINSFVQWAKKNGKLATEGAKNTICIDFNNSYQEMYGLLKR